MQVQRETNQIKTAEKYKSKLNAEALFSKEMEKKKNKVKTKKRKRLIIRNLSFQVTKENLMEIFSKFGKVLDVNIPLKEDGRKRGFAFVQYEKTKSIIEAMKALNNKAINGRCVAIDYAVDKTSYQLKMQNIRQENAKQSPNRNINKKINSDSEDQSDEAKSDIDMEEEEEEDIDENEKRANEFLKEFDSGLDRGYKEEESSDESSSAESEEQSDEEDNESEKEEEDFSAKKSKGNKKSKQDRPDNSLSPSKEQFSTKRKSNDVSEGKTAFLRNVSFVTSNESLTEAMEKYGECEYCVICVDPNTEHPKGTAFVKFKSKESFDKLMQTSFDEPGIVVDGRKLLCSPAVSREAISDQKDALKKPKDKRNLSLIKVGLIMPNSAESQGVSQADMLKRTQLEHFKKQKLRNVNFFVSDTRLMVHNLPKTMNDAQLRKLFKESADKGAVITEARVMKEFKKTNSEGIPLSKGFGFVSFSKHEDALKALMELNNNPKTFTDHKRPIVEFSVENKVALLSKERRKEKIKLRNKKRSDEKQERKSLNNTSIKKETKPNEGVAKKKGKKNRRKERKPRNNLNENHTPDNSFTSEKVNIKTENTSEKVYIKTENKMKGKKNRRKERKPRNNLNKNHTTDNSFTSEKVNIKTENRKPRNKNKSPKKGNKAKHTPSSQENFNNMVNKFKEKLLNKL